MTTLALGVAGAAVGSFFGPIGTSIGWSLGVALGGYLDPQKVQGPRLTDLKLQGSSYGAMEPVIYGTVRLAGNVIALPAELTENEHTSGGGKGGSSTKTTTYTYSVQYVDVLVSDCQLATLYKIWADGRLIYDSGAGSVGTSGVPVTFYTGSETQSPDPTEEAAYGVGLTPAYRGAARLLFNDWQLADFFNRIPQLESLVQSVQAPAMPITLIKENFNYYPPRLWPGYQQIGAWDTDLAVDTVLTDPTDVTDSPRQSYFEDGSFGSRRYNACEKLVCADGTEINLWIGEAAVSATDDFAAMSSSSPYFDSGAIKTTNFAYNAGITVGHYIRGVASTQDNRALFVFTDTTPSSGATHWFKIKAATPDAVAVVDEGTISPEVGELTTMVGRFSLAPPESMSGGTATVAIVESNEQYIWSYFGAHGIGGQGNAFVIQVFKIDAITKNLAHDTTFGWAGSTAVDGKVFGSAPMGDCYPTIYLFKDGWAGTIGSQGANPAWSQSAVWSRLGDATITLAEIVADICDRCGLTAGQYDVTALTDIVDGFIISQQMSGRAAIEALMPVYFFDATEADGKIVFVKRGGESVVTIPDDDLAAHEDGQGLPATLSFVRKQEVDLPASMSVVYYNPDAAYQLSTQTAQRMVTSSESTSTINTTVVLTDDHARRIADALLYIAWLERDQYTFVTARKYERLVPTDVVTVGGIELRITKRTASDNGTIKFEGVRSYAPVFVQSSAGGTASGFVEETVVAPQTTQLVMLDIPLLTNVTAQSTLRPAMAGTDRASWRGAGLLKSIDGGASYAEIISASHADVIGTAVDALAMFTGGNIFDESNSVSVTIANGLTLDSATSEAVINGANEAVLGREIIQYRDATLTATETYTLTGLLRGRRGTEWAMASHVAGESFVALPTGIEIPSLSSEFGTERQYKAVTIGSSIASAAVHNFTARGVSVTPLSPVHPAAGINGDGDWIFMWSRRARNNAAWLDFTDVPLDETTESYKITFYSDGTYVTALTSFDCTAATFTLTVAQQTTIYGSPQSDEPPWTVAQYGAAGPGYDTLGRSPVVVPPPPLTPPPVTGDVPLGDVQWHADYRYPDTTHANKNFNWLQVNYSSSWAWAYMDRSTSQLSNDLVIDLGDEGSRIINTMGGSGHYAPAGFMVPFGVRIDIGPTLHSLYPLVDIPLPYPDDAS